MDVIISPQGGHGTSFVMNHFEPPPLKRPDVVFGKEYDLDGPADTDMKAWRQRSAGAPLFNTPGSSLFHLVKSSRRPVLLSGRCSIRQAFLTRYGIQAVAIVRHPLHAYISFMSHQHPNHAVEFGGFNTIGAVHRWLRWWRPVVLDIIMANAKIVRFEHAAKDAKPLPLNYRAIFSQWKSHLRNFGELKPELEDVLKSETWDLYSYLYGPRWNI